MPFINRKKILVLFGFLAAADIIAWSLVFNLSGPAYLKVVFFDVGQGDSIFIETPQKHQILIDGGPGSDVLAKLAKEMPFYDRTLDLIILTHPEKDHIAGLLEVVKKYKIDHILWTGAVKDTAEWKEWTRLLQGERADIRLARRGQKIILQQEPGIFLNILSPEEDLSGKEIKNINDTSVVCRMSFSDSSFLFTGDITSKTESELVKDGVVLRSKVLKVCHHGSKTSSSEDFLKAVSPDAAIIQVGRNNYGHPSPEVLARLKNFGIDVLRNDKNGDIKIISDGNGFKIFPQIKDN